jgi:hypothetical protein
MLISEARGAGVFTDRHHADLGMRLHGWSKARTQAH